MTLPATLRAGVLISLLAFAIPAAAGTLCGTVKDGVTNAPVARAGVFLRFPSGAYTGYYGGTAADGTFCIGAIPAGTYDLEVRRDNYVVAYLRGVVVTQSDVDVSLLAGGGVELAPPAPNPATATARLAWALPSPARVRISVVDVIGRTVRAWSGDEPSGSGSVAWDLRDTFGHSIPAGIYHVVLDATGQRRVRTLVRVR